jgi:hypothetical protein
MATVTATPADLWRLADEAERRGVRILVEPISGDHFATSGSDPTKLYRLTHFSCTCKGFQHWQRCVHHSLLIAQLGWLPDLDPDPPTANVAATRPGSVECPECRGLGTTMVKGKTGTWFEVRCFLCEGVGKVESEGDEDDRHTADDAAPIPVEIGRGRDPWDVDDEVPSSANRGIPTLHTLVGEPLQDGGVKSQRKLAA